jgi:small subunit ribosomal protein S18
MMVERKRPRRDDEDEDKKEFDSSDDAKPQRSQRRFQRRRQTVFVPDYVDWKDVEYLRRFIPERGKILPRRISGVTAKDQRRIATAIKRARAMALLPYVAD